MAYNSETRYGRAMMDAIRNIIPLNGRVFVVLNSNDATDYNYDALNQVFKPDNEGQVRLFTDLATAYAATQSNNNDVIVLAGHTSHKLTSMLTVDKNRVHFIGLDGGGRKIGARALISNTGVGAATDYAMIKITGTGCSFRNIKFANNWTVAQNVSSVWDYSNNSYFENCDIESLGSAHLTNASAASLICQGVESIYKNCTIGQQTLLTTSTNGQALLFGATTATRTTRCIFENCYLQGWSSDTGFALVRAIAGALDSSRILFKNCDFINRATYGGGGVAGLVAVVAAASFGGAIDLASPNIFGAAKPSTSTGVFCIAPVVTGTTTAVGVQTS